ncbi:MAG: methyltransferase, partial [Myxococcales bacterium]
VGDGALSRALWDAFPTCRLTCVDISQRRLQAAEELLRADGCPDGGARFVACNLDTKFGTFPGASQDVVIALDIMEHVFDVFGFLANCRRVLREGGQLVLRVPNIAYIRHRARLLVGELPVTASWFGPEGELGGWRDRYGWDGGHLHYFTLPMLRKLLTESGFRVEGCHDAGARFQRLRDLLPGLLYGNLLMVASRA